MAASDHRRLRPKSLVKTMAIAIKANSDNHSETGLPFRGVFISKDAFPILPDGQSSSPAFPSSPMSSDTSLQSLRVSGKFPSRRARQEQITENPVLRAVAGPTFLLRAVKSCVHAG
jgi:hypothetical protein